MRECAPTSGAARATRKNPGDAPDSAPPRRARQLTRAKRLGSDVTFILIAPHVPEGPGGAMRASGCPGARSWIVARLSLQCPAEWSPSEQRVSAAQRMWCCDCRRVREAACTGARALTVLPSDRPRAWFAFTARSTFCATHHVTATLQPVAVFARILRRPP